MRGVPLSGRMLEPGAGEGAIIRALNEDRKCRMWTSVEIRSECASALRDISSQCVIGDFLSPGLSLPSFDVAIGNPDFTIAEQVIKKCLTLSPWVIMLLRLNFLGSDKRHGWISNNVPDVYTLPNRPPFAVSKKTGKVGTDSIEYAWMVWGPHSRGATRGTHELLDVTPLSERKEHTDALRVSL